MTTGVETYEQVHARLRRERGPARDYPCAHGCGNDAAHWAFAHTPDPDVSPGTCLAYSTNLNNYLPLCIKCHNAFDSDQIDVDKDCGLCGNSFRGHPSRVYCSVDCRRVAAERRNAKPRRGRIRENGGAK